MATLNIKNLPDDLYEQLRARAKQQHRSISQEVTHLLAEAVKPQSILDLQGLGRETWQGIDAVEHVRQERDSWG